MGKEKGKKMIAPRGGGTIYGNDWKEETYLFHGPLSFFHGSLTLFIFAETGLPKNLNWIDHKSYHRLFWNQTLMTRALSPVASTK